MIQYVSRALKKERTKSAKKGDKISIKTSGGILKGSSSDIEKWEAQLANLREQLNGFGKKITGRYQIFQGLEKTWDKRRMSILAIKLK